MNDGSGTAVTKRRDEESAPGVVAAPFEPALTRLTALAADLLKASSAGLALIDGDRMRVEAGLGLDGAQLNWPVSSPLADPVSRIVLDTSSDGETRRHPLVAGSPHAGFLASSPLISADGATIGSLFVLDGAARTDVPPDGMARLAALAAVASDAVDKRRALKRAEEEAEASSRLLADVSHELRTPLNGIMGFTQLLKGDEALDVEARRSVERIEEAGRGLLSIVNDALDVSRFESGMVRLDERAFSPERLVEDCAAMVRPDADRKGLTLSVQLPKTPASLVLGDPARLRQVLLNLLSNAVKFTESGTVLASLSLAKAEDQAGVVDLSFTVADSGMGIPRDDIPRLFNRFVQADRSVGHRFGGSGLGLAISKSLVEAMGGAIHVRSTPGAGTQFVVDLSLPRALGLSTETPPRDRVPGQDRLKDSAILLAEDAPLNQKLVIQMLAALGASVDVVADGLEAVEAVARRDYALVLMDMEMPVLGGLDATRRIRALPGAAGHVPIVALTANVYPEQLDLCRDAGMDDVLTKPFGPDDLTTVALRWIRVNSAE